MNSPSDVKIGDFGLVKKLERLNKQQNLNDVPDRDSYGIEV